MTRLEEGAYADGADVTGCDGVIADVADATGCDWAIVDGTDATGCDWAIADGVDAGGCVGDEGSSLEICLTLSVYEGKMMVFVFKPRFTSQLGEITP